MTSAEKWLQARGVWKVQLMVRGDNVAAREFYHRLGYKLADVVCLQKTLN
jgi:ribosomal protein S18 acetylase RimI-like enzyme